MSQTSLTIIPPGQPGDRHLLICQHRSCRERGSALVLQAFQRASLPPRVLAIASPCQGQCHLGVTVRLVPTEVWYCQVTPADVPHICAALHQGDPLGHRNIANPVRAKLNPRIHPPGSLI
ncbi:ferredoxin [Picosynechococcus sp. NKBG042902]|uniref:(2Fe-2S) ferredoxin domain-containing protein n=1 Tax=Picosynechococcus sp. NKBG042902 TaxID=490193 RepID=UPI0005EF653B|nr:(2Fe-2S) ferredoxin domain-containing protein [Picosynechococcus sp. NKBG042902]